MYRVIKFFTDLKDNKHPYNAGDAFPRVGKDVTPERIEELSTNRNKQGTPLIEFVPDEPATIPADNVEMAQEKPRRGRPKKG